jgi:para-nitrobenzyl esterase
MVWLHGGGFNSLSGSSPMYDGVNLCKRGDIVVVTLNHRLNVFGFLHLGDLVGGDYAESGNVGMLDIVQALRWVQRNAPAFGGDASNVTIFGESGGGRKVSTLLAMPAARGLFHRAIIQSGPGLHLQPRDFATSVAEAFLKAMGETPATVARLDEASPVALLKAYEAVERAFDQGGRARGRVEQRGFVPTAGTATLPQYAFDPVATELSADVPVMIGTNRHEMALFTRGEKEIYDRTLTEDVLRARLASLVGNASDRVMDVYSRLYPNVEPAVRWILMTSDRTYRHDSITLAQRKAALGRAPVYMYLFEWCSLADPKLLAHHGLEIAFAFDNTTKVPGWSGGGAAAAALADRMSEAWLQFARSGNPATPKLPAWPAYSAATRATMRFDDECTVTNDPDREVRQLWATV